MHAFYQWLADFSHRESCDLTQLEDTAALVLEFDHGVSLTVEHSEDDYLTLSSDIGLVAPDDTSTMELLLTGNLMAVDNRAGFMGLDPVSRRASLLQQFPLPAIADAQALQTMIEDFLAAATAWRNSLEQHP